MFNFGELKQIHLEITNNCQASCPMCSRNIHGGLENPNLKIQDWSLEDFKKIINQDVLDQVLELYFCGNYGDPVINKNLKEMCHYVANNSNVNVKIHTNGGIQNEQWWADLPKHLPKDHLVIFGIDGLEDTNHLYRIGVNFNKVINNAKAFIENGGKASWAFIEFKHNEHQLLAAEQMSKDLGFESFTYKQSYRFVSTTSYPVYDKNGKTIYMIEPPTNNKIVFIKKSNIENYKSIVEQSKIECIVKENKEVYIDAHKRLFPCCFIGMQPYVHISKDDPMIFAIRNEILEQHNKYTEHFGGLENLDCTVNSIKDIINSDTYQTIWDELWNNPNKMIVCAKTCGKNKFSKSQDQFIKD